jgi:hypothetical protein
MLYLHLSEPLDHIFFVKMQRLLVLPDLGYNIDMEYWGRDFKPNKNEFYKEGIINRYITLAIMHYCTNSTISNRLFYEF